MKYMLLMNVPAGPYQISSWAPEDLQAHIGFMMRLNQGLKANGELVAAEALAGPDQARFVRAGEIPVTDGIFAESKEFLAGYWLIDVASAERARHRPRGLRGAGARRRAAQPQHRSARSAVGSSERPLAAIRPAIEAE